MMSFGIKEKSSSQSFFLPPPVVTQQPVLALAGSIRRAQSTRMYRENHQDSDQGTFFLPPFPFFPPWEQEGGEQQNAKQ